MYDSVILFFLVSLSINHSPADVEVDNFGVDFGTEKELMPKKNVEWKKYERKTCS